MADIVNLQQNLRLSFSAENLKTKDLTGTINPIFELHKPGKHKYEMFYTSSVLMDNHNPTWSDAVNIQLDQEQNQKILFKVFDYRENAPNVLIAHAEFFLTLDLLDGITVYFTKAGNNDQSKKMRLLIRGALKKTSKLLIAADFRCSDLKQTHFYTKDTTAISLSRLNTDGSDNQLYFSEWVSCSQNPDWKAGSVMLSDLCDDDLHAPFMLQLWRLRARDGFMELKAQNKTLTVHDCLVKEGEAEKKIVLFDPEANTIECSIWIQRFEPFEPYMF